LYIPLIPKRVLIKHEITIGALNDLVHQGKVRYIGCSNYAGWNLMKGLAISEKNGWENL
jgi:aryl-alcohol dehydrogenase-like predicted oxidoreductase